MSRAYPHYVGLDLGQSQDPSALSILKKSMRLEDGTEPIELPQVRKGDTLVPSEVYFKDLQLFSHYEVKHLQRFELKTSYVSIVERVTCLFAEKPELRGQTLCIDHTGVGRPVADMFRQARREGVRCIRCNGLGTRPAPVAREGEKLSCQLCDGQGKIRLSANLVPVTITAGSGWNRQADGSYRVSKKELASVLQVFVQSEGRFAVTSPSKWSAVFREEAQNFRYKITAAANETFEAYRDAVHDDIILSIAIPLWVAEKASQRIWLA